MQNAAAAIEPAFYDHEDETVQRDRVAADWGADEVFASVPRRRIRGDHHGAAVASRRAAPARRVSGPAAEDDREAADRAAWLAEVEAEVTPAAVPAEVLETAVAPLPADAQLTQGVEFETPAVWPEEPAGPGGRRTVTITGRPDRLPAPSRPMAGDRRRPPRTVDERIGARPDRVAGWAFGMGILLIAVAAVS